MALCLAGCQNNIKIEDNPDVEADADTDADTNSDTDTDTTIPDSDGDGYDAVSDCDDDSSQSYPGATELCDGLDNNCDGSSVDDGIATWIAESGTATDMTKELAGTEGSPAAVSLSSAGTLLVCPGTWYTTFEITDSVSILGLGSDVVLSGGGSGTVITVPDTVKVALQIENVTITEGMSESNPGGLDCDGESDVTITSTIFTDNDGGSGSAIHSPACSFDIIDSTFSDNRATGNGTVNLAGLFSIEGSTFTRNTVTGVGGGLSTSSSFGEVIDTTFSYNTANGSGGGVYILRGNIAFEGSTFSHNQTSSGDVGGGVTVAQESRATFDNCAFSYNDGGASGGGIFAYGINHQSTDFDISNSTFSYNEADSGGAIYMRAEGGADLDTVSFNTNTSSDQGGAIYFHGDTGLTNITNSSFSGNTNAGSAQSLFHSGNSSDYDWEGSSALTVTCNSSGC